jgi:hypothetical protein
LAGIAQEPAPAVRRHENTESTHMHVMFFDR